MFMEHHNHSISFMQKITNVDLDASREISFIIHLVGREIIDFHI